MEVSMITAECPLCGETIDLGLILKHRQGVRCSLCESMLEVVSLQPIKLEWVYFDGETTEIANRKRMKVGTTT